MQLLLFLILFPLITALFMLAVRRDSDRNWIVKLSALAIGAVTVILLVTQFDKGTLYYGFNAEPVNLLMFVLEMVITVIILGFAIKFRNYLVIALTLVETALIIWFESAATPAVAVKSPLFIDQFSIVMALIVGIIGSLICVYSLGYMRHFYQHHTGIPDRTNTFFIFMFVFISAMFGLVFSNSLIWVFFFWEVTTLCSFLLIGITKTEEATKNAFTALWMNLLGGIAFAAAIVYLTYQPAGMLGLDQILVSGKVLVLIPAALIGFAGLTKAAQMPFSSWLVGAMVAPTPVSALLHSSTMVKAGVYILVRFAPVFHGTVIGYTLAFVGAFTFLIASGIAISQSNAKRVLAYSTIANLGLIVACAGIGTAEAIWAAILLIIFHAISKSLMFLCVGTVEHRIKSREIEDMNGLIVRLPRIAAIMAIGIAGHVPCTVRDADLQVGGDPGIHQCTLRTCLCRDPDLRERPHPLFLGEMAGKIARDHTGRGECRGTGRHQRVDSARLACRAHRHYLLYLPGHLLHAHRAVPAGKLRQRGPALAGQHPHHGDDAVFACPLTSQYPSPPPEAPDPPSLHGRGAGDARYAFPECARGKDRDETRQLLCQPVVW